MTRALYLSLSLLLVLAIVGCGKKPGIEQGKQDTRIDQKKDTGDTGNKGDQGDQPITGEGTLKLTTVYFDFDKYNLRPDAVAELKNNYEALKENASIKVQIEGHCDERGTVEYNLALGEKRAKSTRDYLVNLGISANRLSIISYGKEKPASYGSSEEAWGKNRRAQFVELH